MMVSYGRIGSACARIALSPILAQFVSAQVDYVVTLAHVGGCSVCGASVVAAPVYRIDIPILAQFVSAPG